MKLTVVLACAAAALSVTGCGTNSTQPASNAHHFERPYTLRFDDVQQLDSETIRLCGCDDVGIEFCQTRDAPKNSPWLRLPEIFYMAGQMKEDQQ